MRMSPERPLIGVNLLYVRPGYMGGTVRYAYELLKHLIRLDRYRFMIYVQHGVIRADDPVLGYIPKREFRVRGGLAGRVLVEHAVLPFIAQRDGVHLLFSPGFVSPLWGNFRKVVTIHDLYYRLFPQFVRPWQRRYWGIFLPLSLRRANFVIAVSDSTRKDICDAYPWATEKVKRIHLGSDALNRASAECIEESPYCLVVGNITPNKNIETVFAAFALLKDQSVDCRLVIAGSDLFGLLELARRSVSVTLEVKLMEHVDDKSLAGYYSNALCLIQASQYEGFGLPVVEAMNAGCPVVASDIPVLREIGGGAALYFSYDSSVQLSSSIRTLLKDDGLRSRMIALGQAQSSGFQWRKTALQTAELFDDTLGIVLE